MGWQLGHFGRPPAKPDVQQFLKQIFVRIAGFLGRIRKIFIVGDLRIGIGFQDIHVPFRIHSDVDACIATQTKCAIDTLGQMLNLLGFPFGKIPGFA